MALKKFIINFTIEMLYDADKDEFKIIETKPDIKKIETIETKNSIEHEVTDTEYRYGILLLGAKNEVGSSIPLDTEVKVKVNGEIYGRAKSHKKIKGRIDGLSHIFKLITNDLINNPKITISFDLENKILEIITEKEVRKNVENKEK